MNFPLSTALLRSAALGVAPIVTHVGPAPEVSTTRFVVDPMNVPFFQAEALHAITEPTEVVLWPHQLEPFWARAYPGGMTAEDVNNELKDLEVMAENVPKVYDHVTSGKLSYPTYEASVVIAVHDDQQTEMLDMYIAEATGDLRLDLGLANDLVHSLEDELRASEAEIVRLTSIIAGHA